MLHNPLASISAKPAPQMDDKTVWLEALPQEICVRIAASATRYDLELALRLGSLSPILRSAVLQALDYKFDFSRIVYQELDFPLPSPSDQRSLSHPEERGASDSDDDGRDGVFESGEDDRDGSDHISEHVVGDLYASNDGNSEHESDPGTADRDADEQAPHHADEQSGSNPLNDSLHVLDNDPPGFKTLLTQFLYDKFGPMAAELTIRQTDILEEFFAHCADDEESPHHSDVDEGDEQHSDHSADVQSNQDATDELSDDENRELSPLNQVEECGEPEADHAEEESLSDDGTGDSASVDEADNEIDVSSRTSESGESDRGDDDVIIVNNSDVKANTCPSSDTEKGDDEEEKKALKSLLNFHREIAEFFGEDARGMFICAQFREFCSQPALRTCLASQSLEELVLASPGNVDELPRIGPNIRRLMVLFSDDDTVMPVLQHLSSDKLKTLELHVESDVCLHRHLVRDSATSPFLSQCFPNLEELEIHCRSCNNSERAPPYMSSVVKHFQGLKRFGLKESVPEESIEELRGLEIVKLCGEELRDLPEKFPNCVTGITTSREWRKGVVGEWSMCERELELFANCPRLEELNCCIKQGTERDLLRIVGQLTSLGIAFEQNEEAETEAGEMPAPLQPSEGAILDLVRAAPKLRCLHLLNMRVSRSELKEVLISIGDRLEVFEEVVFVNSLIGQFMQHSGHFMFEESENMHELELFVDIVRTAALHNPKLQELSIDLRPEWFGDLDAVQRMIPKLRTALLVLTRRAASLDYRNLFELFCKLADGDIGMGVLFRTVCRNLGMPIVRVQ